MKSVDYISGASIIVRAHVWRELGGFDPGFAPAYCEDSDLAMMIRAYGWKVMYQPLSEVIHFEGISNGRNLHKGLKQYQVVNQKTFYDKWKDILEKQHVEPYKDVFRARDRSQGKRSFFWITDQSSCLNEVEFLELFKATEDNMNVKVILTQASGPDQMVRALQQKGIEVLYGSFYRRFWKLWIRYNKRKNDRIVDRRAS